MNLCASHVRACAAVLLDAVAGMELTPEEQVAVTSATSSAVMLRLRIKDSLSMRQATESGEIGNDIGIGLVPPRSVS